MRRSDARWLAVAPALIALVVPAAARAADVTDVASSFDKDNVFDFNLRVGYDYTSKSAAIKREHEGDANQPAINTLKDLLYKQSTHKMTLQAEIGLYQDLALTLGLPMVLSDSRTLEYDQRLGGECVYAGSGANCVNATNSLSTNSEMTGNASDTNPANYILPPGGYDAAASASSGMPTGFGPNSTMVFAGPTRGGSGLNLLDTFNLGLSWGILSQKRDDTKPTWVIALEYKFSVGNIMRFDRMKPDANHGVSDGLDHVVARTAVSHRFKYVEPYIVFWFDYPFVRRDDTQFVDLGGNAKNAFPQMSGGTRFGLEGVPYEQPKQNFKIAIDINARVQGKFDGRGYSEIWEMLASSPALTCDPNWNLACGLATGPYANNKGYSGITTIENYATLGGEIALVVQASRYIRFRAWFLYMHDQSHFLTIDDVGVPATAGSRVGTAGEYNPAFRPVINEIGRRYKIDDVDVFNAGLWGQVMF